MTLLRAEKINRIAATTLVLIDGDMPEQDFPVSNAQTFKPGAEIEIKAGYGNQVDTRTVGSPNFSPFHPFPTAQTCPAPLLSPPP